MRRRPVEPRPPLGDEDSFSIEAVVFALIPEYELVVVRDETGRQYSLTRLTSGIDLDDLRMGQRVACIVTRRLPRVLSARTME